MSKESKSQESASHGDTCYIEKLPDELVILIFTKLSSSSSGGKDNLDEIKLLGQCSILCKRFNSLTCVVPTLCIIHPSIKTLYDCSPKILKKFKHIRSLQVLHRFYTDLRIDREHEDLPTICSEAAYRPHSYCLAVIMYKNLSFYQDEQVQKPAMQSDVASEIGRDLYTSLCEYTFPLIRYHHMLVSSIKDHSYLQGVVVSDYSNRVAFTLDEDMLVKFRDCSSTNLEHVQARIRFSIWISHQGITLTGLCSTPFASTLLNGVKRPPMMPFSMRMNGDVDREIPGDCLSKDGR
ncbi:hypothetical protein AgCh_025674 [Apium graveolens]